MNMLQNGPKNGMCRRFSVPKTPENGPEIGLKTPEIESNGTAGPYFVPPDLKGH